MNPELEMGRFLATRTSFRATPALLGRARASRAPRRRRWRWCTASSPTRATAGATRWSASASGARSRTPASWRRCATLGQRRGRAAPRARLATRRPGLRPGAAPPGGPAALELLHHRRAGRHAGRRASGRSRSWRTRREALLERAQRLAQRCPSGEEDPHPRGPAPGAGAARRTGLAHLRLRGRAGAHLRPAPGEALAARDVAGMLRSFDYAAAAVAAGGPASARRASARLREAFLEGYRGGHARRGLPALGRRDASTRCSTRSSWRSCSTRCATSCRTGRTGCASPCQAALMQDCARRRCTVKKPADRAAGRRGAAARGRAAPPRTRTACWASTRTGTAWWSAPSARTPSSIHVLPDVRRPHPDAAPLGGVFEARVNGRTEPSPTCSRSSTPAASTFTLRDPYSFLPTLGRAGPVLRGRGPARAALGAAGRAPDRTTTASAACPSRSGRPRAAGVSVVGDFNGWDGRLHAMRRMGASGIWELFIPEVGEGTRYKFEIRPRHGGPRDAQGGPVRLPHRGAARHRLGGARARPLPLDGRGVDDAARGKDGPHAEAVSASTRCTSARGGAWWRTGDRPLTYRELAPRAGRLRAARWASPTWSCCPWPSTPSAARWGYQVGDYYAPTARFGHPDDFRYLVDHLHQQGIGVIVDWVPGHFPRDAHALGRFDGTALYEHADPRQGDAAGLGHATSSTSAATRCATSSSPTRSSGSSEYHVDGLRVDAVASMLYLDYSRKHGRVGAQPLGRPRERGGHRLPARAQRRRAPQAPGRGDDRRGVHRLAQGEPAPPERGRPGLPLQVEHGLDARHAGVLLQGPDLPAAPPQPAHLRPALRLQRALHAAAVATTRWCTARARCYGKMPGDAGRSAPTCARCSRWMWAHPGKKLLFMGGEFGQPASGTTTGAWTGTCSEDPGHRGIQALVADLNRLYREHPALLRRGQRAAGLPVDPGGRGGGQRVRLHAALAHGRAATWCAWPTCRPVPREGYRVGFPRTGGYVELLNTDAAATTAARASATWAASTPSRTRGTASRPRPS